MRNQRTINEAKFEQGIWRFKNGAFCTAREINRKPFGTFDVKLSVAMGGMVGVEIRNDAYPELYWGGTFANYKNAVERIEERFQLIDELVESLEEQAKEAEQERRRIIAKAVATALQQRKQTEEKGKWQH